MRGGGDADGAIGRESRATAGLGIERIRFDDLLAEVWAEVLTTARSIG